MTLYTRGLATRDSGSKWVQSTELDIVAHCAIFFLAGVRAGFISIPSLYRADES